MGSSKQQTSISRINNLLAEWDKGTKATRASILKDFIVQNENKTGPELEEEFAMGASLFLTRLTAWLRTSYMIGTHLDLILKAICIFLSASSGHKFLVEVLEVGGIMTLLEIISLKQAKEEHKMYALECLQPIAAAGRKYKELICESYGIRALAECLAKSKCERTQDRCRNMMLLLAEGNPKFQQQVYKGLIALLLSTSPKAQQMTCQSLRSIQPIVKTANPVLVDPVLTLLRTLHLEVQYEMIELIKDLMEYPEVKDLILAGLVDLLIPPREELNRPHIMDEDDASKMKQPLPVFVQQAAAAKTIGVLSRESASISEQLVTLRVVHGLMHAMGNLEYADSQRQSSNALEYFCRTFPVVADQVHVAMGETLYDLFMAGPDTLYVNMTHIQADVLVSNKVNIPNCKDLFTQE